MAPSRLLTAGRSPLVRKQSQITAFFSTGQASGQSPNPNPIPGPSPFQPKEKKPWHEGRVSSFDASQGKHLILHENGEEEAFDLCSKKFEWLEPPRRLRRLRRLSGTLEKGCSAGNVEDGIGEEDGTADEDRSKAELEDEDDEIVTNSSGRSRKSTASKKRRRSTLEV